MSAELNNGTQVVLDKGALETYPALADPSQWEKRIQLKDRVYEVTIAGKSFIMKEQKTSRHTDVHADHVTGAASRDEFAIAKTMADTRVTVHGDVRLEWERPVGYAELPDGYQFCLFKKVEQAMDYRISTIGKVAEQIKQREGAYAEEFATTLERINELRQLRPDLFESLPGDQMPTFEEFAAAKADALFTQIERDVERGILRAGFIDDDHKAFMITLDDSRGTDQRVQITAIGMDYEFFAADAEKSAHRLAEMNEEERTGEYSRRSLSLAISDMSMETILSLVLAEKMGMALPPNVPSD